MMKKKTKYNLSIKHWQGALGDEVFNDLPLPVPNEGFSNEWCELATDDEYRKVK